jgi:Trp operon repressor
MFKQYVNVNEIVFNDFNEIYTLIKTTYENDMKETFLYLMDNASDYLDDIETKYKVFHVHLKLIKSSKRDTI